MNRVKMKVNGIDLHYIDSGIGPEIILFIHALGYSGIIWKEQLKYFSSLGYRTIAPDLRGHGASTVPLEDPTISHFAQDLNALLEGLGINRPVHLCGVSWGGMISFEFFNQFPEKVKSFILIDTCAFFPEPYRSNRLKMQLNVMDNVSMMEFAHFHVERTLGYDAPYDLFEMLVNILSQNDYRFYRASTIIGYTGDYSQVLPRINIPSIIIMGDRDIDYLASSEYLQSHIRRAEIYIVPGAGHLSHIEQPQMVNSYIRQFLERIFSSVKSIPEITGRGKELPFEVIHR